ncbi:hypothetical protein QFZ30_002446 [Arthrobacter pascens]|uniref:hypothetical protein n=1 Tax=Arthrobacter pascens TaxID=1677 RepID=UPI002793825B|nr:hypothetical protein [Arthrobacter pascens]MDQ0679064.1 hypothetical protein [Arthrobacter pascens]
MNHSIKTPRTVREAGDMAEKLGMKLPEFLEMLGPIPMPPAGYTLAPHSDDKWIGRETMNRGWIITPAWNATSNTHSIELWAADHEPPDYTVLTPPEALQLAADLITAAQALPGGTE